MEMIGPGDRAGINEGETMGESPEANPTLSVQPSSGRRSRASIVDAMGLVAALVVAFRWPGLCVPVGLFVLSALAYRRGFLAPPTRSALRQVALALYLPTAAGLVLFPLAAWDEYQEIVSPAPAFVPGALIGGFEWARWILVLPEGTAPRIILSLASLAIAAALVSIARRGLGWRIAGVVVAFGLSIASMAGHLLAALANA